MTIYERNLLVLKERDEELCQAVMDYVPGTEELTFRMERARNGQEILCAQKDHKQWYLNSRYDPVRECDQFAGHYGQVLDYSVIFFWGIGNGLIASKMLEIMGEHVQCLIYEPSPSLFLFVLQHFDLTSVLRDSRTRFVVCDLNDKYLEVITASYITIENYRMCYLIDLPQYGKLYGEELDQMKAKIRFHIDHTEAMVRLSGNFEIDLVRNEIYNMRSIFSSNCEEEYRDIFPTDRPVIIVAAGPSLEKNVEDLRDAKGRFLIMAVDTALPYLIQRGVIPDLVIAVDPQKPVQLFEGLRNYPFNLAVTSDVNYEILEIAQQKVIFISSENDYFDRLFRIGGKRMHQLPSGGSVSTSAFTLARRWGYNKLVLVGQDLALAPGKIHAGNPDIGNDRLEEQGIPVEGYYGDTVYTLRDYGHYREWYEMTIRINQGEIEVINATEGGARIEGTVQMTLKEVIATYSPAPFDFEKTIREIPPAFSVDQREKIIRCWKDSLSNLEVLRDKLREGIQCADQGISLLQEEQHDGRAERIAEIQVELGRITQECESLDEIYYLNVMAAKKEADVLGDIYFAKEDAAEEVIRIFEKIKKYMQSMCDKVEPVKEMFQKIIEDAE